jgi:DNA invertase Pin-like site-specific DNA recombinase
MTETHPEKRLFGYARVSTYGQTLDSQLEQHRALMLAVLGGLADVERDLIRTRTAEGRSRATAQGKAMGRPRSLLVGGGGDTGPRERGHQTPRAGCYVEGIGRELRPQHHHHAPRHARRVN